MNNFTFRDKNGFILAVADADDVTGTFYSDNLLVIKYRDIAPIQIPLVDGSNVQEFLNLISTNNRSSADCCVKNEEVLKDADSPVGVHDIKNEQNNLYHVIFDGNTASTIVIHDVNTLFVDQKDSKLILTSRRTATPKLIPVATYGNLFSKLPYYYYVIEDLFAFNMIDISSFDVVQLNESSYKISIQYCDDLFNSINYTLDIDSDRIIHMLNAINSFG